MFNSRGSVTNIVAHPADRLFWRAKRNAEDFNKNSPPIRPSASRTTQNPLRLRPMKNNAIESLITVASGRCGKRAVFNDFTRSYRNRPGVLLELIEIGELSV
jgi:hypothetical protein